MSQLLIVAASTILAADADQPLPQTKTSAAVFSSEPWSDDGKTDGYGVTSHHQPIVHLNSDGFEIAASDQGASVVTPPPAPNSPGFGDVVSAALRLMTDLNDIPSTHPGNSSDQAYLFIKDNNMSPVGSGFNNEAGFLALKSAVASTVATETSSAQIAGVLHLNASASGSGALQGAGFYENGTIVFQLPSELTSVTSLASVATQQVGNADNFLAGNNIIIDLHQAASIFTDATVLPDAVKQTATDTSLFTHNHASATTSTTSTTQSTVSAPAPVETTTGNAIVSTTSSTEAITSTVFLKTLDLFMVDTPALGVYYSNDHYLFYNAADVTSKAPQLESVSMTFTDGSSISIVGQVQFLNNIIAHAQ